MLKSEEKRNDPGARQKTRSPVWSPAVKYHSSNEVDSDNEGENELAALKHKQRILKGDQRAYEKETQEEIRRQRELIQQSEAERNEILMKLNGSFSKSFSAKENKLSGKLKSLLEKIDDVDTQIEEEKQKQLEIENKTKEIEKKIGNKRRSAPINEDQTKKINRLTDQVTQANRKFSKLLANNSNLRDDIEILRCEREKFLQLYKKLEKELQGIRRESEAVMDKANEAYQSREEVQARIARVAEQQEKDIEQYNIEMREIHIGLANAGRLNIFLKEKMREREPDEQFIKAMQEKEAKQREQKIEHKVILNKYEEAVEKINEIIRASAIKDFAQHKGGSRTDIKSSFEGTNDDERQRTSELGGRRKSIALCNHVKEASGESDTDRKKTKIMEHRRRSSMLVTTPEDQERLREINKKTMEDQAIQEEEKTMNFSAELFYKTFIEREDKNFALFNYVTEQASDIENIQKDILQIKTDIELLKAKNCTANQEQKNTMRELEQNWNETSMAADKLQEKIERAEKILNDLKVGVNNLAKKMELNTKQFSQCLGWAEGVTDQNVLTYLGIIEQRTNELLAAHSFFQDQDAGRMGKKHQYIQCLLGNSAPSIATDFEIPLPSISDEDDRNEEYIHPLTKYELQEKVLKSIQLKDEQIKEKNAKQLRENHGQFGSCKTKVF
ncbi:coiled-coil domain-containing protein 63-like [Heptranchias perlo]|uniref:coiled-coil domain-containing protein 63-like n=1 Tax=Heptranchias perlo TaxID=212740 RepID=UPI00355952AF